MTLDVRIGVDLGERHSGIIGEPEQVVGVSALDEDRVKSALCQRVHHFDPRPGHHGKMVTSGVYDTSSRLQLGTQTFVYLGHNDHPNAEKLAKIAGGIIVAGARGRRRLRALRDAGYSGPALYDLVEYKEAKGGTPRLVSTISVDIEAQAQLGVERVLDAVAEGKRRRRRASRSGAA